ncbi:MAG: hypothetical protein ACTHJW_26765 [Streptosporangiaceae bacterium]
MNQAQAPPAADGQSDPEDRHWLTTLSGLADAGTDLYQAVTIVPGKQAWWVEPAANGGFRQRPIEAHEI